MANSAIFLPQLHVSQLTMYYLLPSMYEAILHLCKMSEVSLEKPFFKKKKQNNVQLQMLYVIKA